MANLRRGIEAERKCMKELEKQGFHVSRSAASKGAYDLIAMNASELRLIQVKRTKHHARRAEKRVIALLRDAPCPQVPCIKKQLWCWIDHHGWFITEIEM